VPAEFHSDVNPLPRAVLHPRSKFRSGKLSSLCSAERFACWLCPVCEVKLTLDDLRVDELTSEALCVQPDADSFSFGPDGLSFAPAESSLEPSSMTPATAKKVFPKDNSIVDDIDEGLVQRLDSAMMRLWAVARHRLSQRI
jgi:hypothetical protein